MRLESLAAKAFNMTEDAWERHANPWSIWTRYLCLPLFVLAVDAYKWIGGWNLVAIALILLWVWLNPRIFGRPASTDNWASKSVLGERVLLAAAKNPIPRHHKKAISIVKIIMLLGVVFVVTGFVFSLPACIWSGVSIIILGKSWFLDRMVWLYEDMSRTHPEYQKWLY